MPNKKPVTDRIVVQLLMPSAAGLPAVEMRVARAALRMSDGDERVFAGIPLMTRRTARSFFEDLSYVVVGLKEATHPANQVAADGILNALILELRKRGEEQGKSTFLPTLEMFLRERRRQRSIRQRALFGLMFYRWVKDFLPKDYWTGTASLHESFVVFLYTEMLGLQPGFSFNDVCKLIAEEDSQQDTEQKVRLFVDLLFYQTFVGTAHAVDLVGDVFLVASEAPGLHSGKDIALAWFLIVGGIISGATEMALLALLIDVAIGVCQFLFDLAVIERDGEITAEEQQTAAWSFGFVFVPLIPFGLDSLGLKKLALLLTVAPLPILLIEFIGFIKECVENLIEYKKRLGVARAAGFDGYAELDLGSTIVIPLNALTRE